MQLVYATGQPGQFKFDIASTLDRVPQGARVFATCFKKSVSQTLDEPTFRAMTDDEYCELLVLIRQAREREQRQMKERFLRQFFQLLSGLIVATVVFVCLAVTASAATFEVTTTTDNGDNLNPTPGSLRKAILDANANPGIDTIAFNIPGSGVHVIAPSSTLPKISDPVTIDGYTQPGASANSLAVGSNAVLQIELTGAAANSAAGLTIAAGNSTIRGLAINRFNFDGILIQTNGGNTIAGNYIGTDAAGVAIAVLPNNGAGIFMNSANNVIGGSSPADRNVIAGDRNANGSSGVYVSTINAKGNKVIGNYIGTDPTGMVAQGFMGNGIVLSDSSQTTIGGLTAAERNVIVGSFYGITLFNASSNQIAGNYIGTLADGSKGAGNDYGVSFASTSKNNTVGGTSPGSANLIAWNILGVIVGATAVNNAILGNSIHDTSNYLGIDLYSGAYAVTPNDDNTGDADTGANNLQNFPVITSVVSSGGVTTFTGTLDSAFSTTFRIELFANQACHSSGFGEGENYLGFTNVTTDAGGKGNFIFTMPTANVVGGFFTATATDPNGNTSEFSACTSGGAASPGTLQLSTGYIGQFENNGSFNLNVTRTNGSAGTVTVNYATTDGTATTPLDYTATSGTLVFNDGETSKPISVPIVDNNVPEGSHFLTISLSNPTGGAVLGNITTAKLSIQDNDYPTLSINDISQVEGNNGATAFTFTVTSSNAITNNVNVNYSTADGTGAAGSDYQATSGTLTIPAGQTSRTITVLVNGDPTPEADETFFVNLSNPDQAIIGKASGTGTIINDDGAVAATFDFAPANYNVQEDLSAFTVTVTRSGDTSSAASVNYATADGTAVQKSDYEIAAGTLNFAPGETSKTLTLLINEDAYVEGNETFNIILANPSGAALGQQATASVIIVDDAPESAGNPIDDPQTFVATQYHDFLNREADAAGLAFWTNEIISCGNDAQCIEIKRINVSAAFFLSIEFQQTGYLRYLLQKESFASMPKYAEFMRDLQEVSRGVIVGAPNWEQQLKDNQAHFAEEWINRPAFKAMYDNMSNADYVNALYMNAGIIVTQAERQSVVNALDTAAESRSAVLLDVAANAVFREKETGAAFVMMQYFGYLRRDPDTAPDSDLSGYNFWLNKLNAFGGDFQQAEMVKAFLSSSEYRSRFGQ